MKRVVVLSMVCASGFAQAEMDGSKILMEEAERAKEVQRLQYQAELLKQRAEIAKYMQEIQSHGGDVSEFGGVSSAPARTASPSSVSAPVAVTSAPRSRTRRSFNCLALSASAFSSESKSRGLRIGHLHRWCDGAMIIVLVIQCSKVAGTV